MKKLIQVLLYVIAFSGMLVGCNKQEEAKEHTATEKQQQVQQEKTASTEENSDAIGQIFPAHDNLAQADTNQEAVPAAQPTTTSSVPGVTDGLSVNQEKSMPGSEQTEEDANKKPVEEKVESQN